jgi:hypothetical protein
MNTLSVYVFLTCSTTEYFCELESGDDNNTINTKNKNNYGNATEDNDNNISINDKITITAKPYFGIILELLGHKHTHIILSVYSSLDHTFESSQSVVPSSPVFR